MTTELLSTVPEGYVEWVKDLKDRSRSAQQKAAIAANSEMISLYWQIGRDILDRQDKQAWGAKVIDRLAADLRREFPEMKGVSSSNLKSMLRFAWEGPARQFGQQPADQLPWFHVVILITKISVLEEREYYARAAIEHGWARAVLVHQIESGLYHRQGKAITNFDKQLPAPQSELTKQTLKDPYIFDFLSIGKEAHERDIENALVEHITRFLLELGAGFSYVGKEVHLLEGGGEACFFLFLFFLY